MVEFGGFGRGRRGERGMTPRPRQWKIRPKNPVTAPITLPDDGLGDALGSGSATGGVGGCGAGGGGSDGADARMPPCSEHVAVGAVPIRKGRLIARGHEGVAIPPVWGSVVAKTTPEGSGKSGESGGTAPLMKATQAGSAACAPGIPRL